MTSRRKRNTFPSGAFPAPRRMEKRNRTEPGEFTCDNGSLLGSGERMAHKGGSLLGVVHEAKMSPQKVTRCAPGNTLDSVRKLYDRGPLSRVVVNGQNVFTVGSPHFTFLMAAHPPGILGYLLGSNVSGIFAWFACLYAWLNYQRLSEYGDLRLESCYKTLIGILFRMGDTFSSDPDVNAESESLLYYNALYGLYGLPLEEKSAPQSYIAAHVESQSISDDAGGGRKTPYRGKAEKNPLRFAQPLDYLEKAMRATKQDQPLAKKGGCGVF